MRRAFLLVGIAASATALFTTVSYATDRRSKTVAVREYKEKLADLTFCRTGYEIASSKTHFLAGAEQGEYKEALLEMSDDMRIKQRELDRLISEHLAEAKDLPMEAEDRALMLEKVQWDAEVEAVQTAGWVEEPDDFLDHIEERCQPYLN